MTTFPDVCLELVKELLECAAENGAQCIAHHLSPVPDQRGGVPEAREQDVWNVL